MMAPVLEARGVSVTFGTQKVLDEVSLKIEAGSVYGLIGPNGAGKSTFIDSINGYLPNATGEVIFDGESITGLQPHQRAQRGLARTFQTLELFEDLTVRENLLVAAERRSWSQRFVDLVRPPKRLPVDNPVDRSLKLLEIEHLAGALPANLSHGQRNVVSVARALAAEPKLVMLDEPAAGLDSDESQALGRRLRRLTDSGMTVFLIDHDLQLVLNVCDRIHMLDYGRTVAEGTPQEIRTNPTVISAYLGVTDGPGAASTAATGNRANDEAEVSA